MFSDFSLFDILAIIYVFRSVQLGLQIWRQWGAIRSEPFNAHKKQLANQASYFIAVPMGVLVHEVFHAIAVWMVGGQVISFVYRAFYGYVQYQGNLTSVQTWFVAIAGTLGSLLFGLAIWFVFRKAPSQTLRYFGVRAFRFQVYFSLIYYPLFTLLGFDGDWKTIYDFSATPILSAGTAVLHLGTLLLFWRGDRAGWFEAPSHESIPEQERFEQLAETVALSPHDAQAQIQYIDTLRRGGANNKAQNQLQQFLAQNPNSAVGHLESAAIYSAGQRQIPKKAAENAEEALRLGLSNPQQIVYAHELAGRYRLEIGQVDQAVESFSQALETLKSSNKHQNQELLFQLHILRSQAYRRGHKYEKAYQDIMESISIAQISGNPTELNQAQQELETLEKHASRAFGATHVKSP